MHKLAAACAALITGCAHPPPEPKPPAPPKVLTGDLTTPAGAKLRVPAGFTARQHGNVIVLTAPDNAVTVYLVELAGTGCPDAVKAAWAAARPAHSWKAEQTQRPPRHGYDEVFIETYAAQEDGTRARALARRKGKRIWVALIIGKPAGLDERRTQIMTCLSRMKAPGVKEIDLSGREPRSITDGESRKALIRFIRRAMRRTGTPGLAIAVVEKGKIVLAEGFGIRRLGKNKKVNADTLMMVGSVSGSLTTLMMAALVDAGKLDWTAPVTRVDPGFRLADSELTGALTVEHLVCSCAGLPRKDLRLVFAHRGKAPADVFKELALMRPTTRLRETYQYQNHMAAAGGYVAARAWKAKLDRGEAYDTAMRELVFRPLGMRSTTLDHNSAVESRNRAAPHARDLKGRHHRVPFVRERFVRYVRPGGGIWSTARDMARFVITEIARGVTPAGKRVVSEKNLTRRWKPQVKSSAGASHGLGWTILTDRGIRTITHAGGTMGFAAKVAFLPDKGVGVVMVSNGTGGHLVESVVVARLMELWFGIDDGARARLDHALSVLKREVAELHKRTRRPRAGWIRPLLGRHRNDEIGTVAIKYAGRAGRYILDSGTYFTRVRRYDRPDGKSVLLVADVPLAGLELEPVEGGTFEMRRAQERYRFRRVARRPY
jgi:CubicO group peptidase (beta-lactamase class C family)